jgi:hypothetical protein
MKKARPALTAAAPSSAPSTTTAAAAAAAAAAAIVTENLELKVKAAEDVVAATKATLAQHCAVLRRAKDEALVDKVVTSLRFYENPEYDAKDRDVMQNMVHILRGGAAKILLARCQALKADSVLPGGRRSSCCSCWCVYVCVYVSMCVCMCVCVCVCVSARGV